MKTKITFEGTFSDLVAFVNSTFKDPSKLNLRVNFGGTSPRTTMDEAVDQLRKLAPYTATETLQRAMAEILREMKVGNKIPAIKACREYTGCGLMEGKNFVESQVVVQLCLDS